jgi:predicted aminopeptidase
MRIRLALLLALTPSLSGCYVLQQGVGQLQLLAKREPVATLKGLPADKQAKLDVIAKAKAFAESDIGLRHTSNYEDYVALDRDAVTYVVSAAPKDKLVAYTWWFPIIGSVPYKGFFNKADAVREQESLQARGYDTILRGVPAFSTLGWLSDPIYSPFLGYEVPTLANVVIHETTHATLFLSGQASFNEGFATFVGNQGAIAFLAKEYGPGSQEVKAARDALADNVVFTEFIQAISRDLEALYAQGLPADETLARRAAFFDAAKMRFTEEFQPRMKSHQFRHFPGAVINNAALISYRTYYNKLDRFEKAFDKQGRDLRATVTFFKDQVAKAQDPEKFLDKYVAN